MQQLHPAKEAVAQRFPGIICLFSTSPKIKVTQNLSTVVRSGFKNRPKNLPQALWATPSSPEQPLGACPPDSVLAGGGFQRTLPPSQLGSVLTRGRGGGSACVTASDPPPRANLSPS